MNIVKNINQFDENNIFFCEPIKNNIINGFFFRILDSNDFSVINGIYLLIELDDFYIEPFYNKFKCIFNINQNTNQKLIESIKRIEDTLLTKININKIPKLKIYDQIKNGFIKFFSNENITYNNKFILKISGIWENDMYYGLTYKFTYVT